MTSMGLLKRSRQGAVEGSKTPIDVRHHDVADKCLNKHFPDYILEDPTVASEILGIPAIYHTINPCGESLSPPLSPE